MLLELQCDYYCKIKPPYFNCRVGDSFSHKYENKYNAVISNPPYNSNGCRASGSFVYPKFIELGIKILAQDGYLLYVTPPAWRQPKTNGRSERSMIQLMTQENYMFDLFK
jgi:16S rRNA G1207 methylase RsmC